MASAIAYILLFALTLHLVGAMFAQMSVQMPECSTWCPQFCAGKCKGTEPKPSCNGDSCHCDCSATSVVCNEAECKEFCDKHSGGRRAQPSCVKGTVCRCLFGDPTDDLRPMPYVKQTLRAEVEIRPE